MKAITVIAGIVCGTFVGFGLGAFAAMGIGYWSQFAHPNDPSAGGVAIVVIATAPLGAILGAAVGGVVSATRPRLFRVTILPIAMVLVGLLATFITLQSIDRPRTFVVEVLGTPGVEYVGFVSADGNVVPQQGALPAKFEFEAFRIEMAFALVKRDEPQCIAVNVIADGNDLHTGSESQTGVHLELKSSGYSETFGGTSTYWSRMSEEEVEHFIKDQTPPQAT